MLIYLSSRSQNSEFFDAKQEKIKRLRRMFDENYERFIYNR